MGRQGLCARRATSGVESLEPVVEALPELGARCGDDHGDTVASEQDPRGGLEQESPEALPAEALLALDVEELGSCGHEIGCDEQQKQLDFIGSEAVVDLIGLAQDATAVVSLGPLGRREPRRESGVAVPEVGLGRAPLAVALEQGQGVLLHGGSAGEKEEVVQEQVLLLVGTFDDDEHDPAGVAPGFCLVGEFMQPGAALGGRPSRRSAEKRLSQQIELAVAADATDVGDSLRLERFEEGRLGEASIGTEPDPWDEGAEPLDVGKDEVESSRSRMGVPRPEASAQEEPSQDARHQRMVAAHLVVAVVRAFRLVSMHLVGQRVQIDGDLRARAEERSRELAQDHAEPIAVGLARQRPLQPRERRLRADPVGPIPSRCPERVITSPFRDREPEYRIVMQERDVVLVQPSLGEREDARTNQLEEGMLDPICVTRIAQVSLHERRQAQPVAQLPKQQGSGIGRESFRPRLDVHRPVEIQRKQSTLRFTHGVFWGLRDEGRGSHPHLITGSADTPWAFYSTDVALQSLRE